ncbi:RNA-binding transcriptional accessory protein [Halosquirtibacter laminarini]|uniref:RNA-binding transcriptional accessory protein n=1 Tax=Halosquirtibacter laminarini TaxID=3374600 RepID=A0AC61NCI3_9BACT|nr:RNA-binding transcriptional accessory protein [Prolixibacteraceae bacterium]
MTSLEIKHISESLGLRSFQVENTIALFEEGATVPFIARYRKERTDSLDEVIIAEIQQCKEKWDVLNKRKKAVLKSIETQNLLTETLKTQIEEVTEIQQLEDIYLPYKPKRRTKATIARENGLEPLAKMLMKQNNANIEHVAEKYLNNNIQKPLEAIEGAQNIIAEWVNENAIARDIVRDGFQRESSIEAKVVKGKEEEGDKYSNYFEWREAISKCPSHRMLAMRRAEKEGVLKIAISSNNDRITSRLNGLFVKKNGTCHEMIEEAVHDGYKRLLMPSICTEVLKNSKEEADKEAISVFCENLKQLLLSAPLGEKRIMALDPGFRTGCKLVCLDQHGYPRHNETIFPHKGKLDYQRAQKKVAQLANAHKIDAIAIGNGTASRETEAFIKRVPFDRDLSVFIVSEDGASIYSASKVARDEFPEYDITVRGAISIGRRLMDPLAELVKIDPQSIGVGQYQHDVDQKLLKEGLDRVVSSCVNRVGVNVNTASTHLLHYVSGLGPTLAKNIVEYRKENGAFTSRKQLKKVKLMGDKSFEQCAGFLRIDSAANPLDNSAVHPEAYSIVTQMSKDLGVTTEALIGNENLCDQIDIYRYATEKLGVPTLLDIIEELKKPGVDPRDEIETFKFAENIFKLEDITVGMILPGIVTNITNFGAFVDVGIKQQGLVHISEMADRFISDPNEVVKLHQHIKVKVIDIDLARKRLQLSLKQI